MKEVITITALSECRNGEVCIIGYTSEKELEVFYAKKDVVPHLVYKGDMVAIEFEKLENEPKKVVRVEEWRIINVKERLIKIIDECIAENKRKTEELNNFLGRYELAESGIRKAKEKAAKELKEFIARKIKEIETIYDQAIEQLDDEEQRELERRNNSLEFQQLIREKAEILRKSDITKIDTNVLREYIKEFKNYPVAIVLLSSGHSGKEERVKILDCLPEDNRGERQNRMNNSRSDVIAAINGLVEFNERGNKTRISMVECCKDYINHQAEDFSIPSEAVWTAMNSSKTQRI